jgi:SPP1 family predicted phage head-tail adaptor
MRLTFTTIAARRLRIDLQEPAETPDGLGGVTRGYAHRISLWGRLEPLSAAERGEAQRAESAVTHRLTLRWRADVTAGMRFVAGPRVFNVIAAFDPDGHRRDLVCLIEEVSA